MASEDDAAESFIRGAIAVSCLLGMLFIIATCAILQLLGVEFDDDGAILLLASKLYWLI
jgi:hypothetical protein